MAPWQCFLQHVVFPRRDHCRLHAVCLCLLLDIAVSQISNARQCENKALNNKSILNFRCDNYSTLTKGYAIVNKMEYFVRLKKQGDEFYGYDKAHETCRNVDRKRKSALAKVPNCVVNGAIIGILQQHTFSEEYQANVFFGLRKYRTPTQAQGWVWFWDRTLVRVKNWAAGYPSTSDANGAECATFNARSGSWINIQCNGKGDVQAVGSVCERTAESACLEKLTTRMTRAPTIGNTIVRSTEPPSTSVTAKNTAPTPPNLDNICDKAPCQHGGECVPTNEYPRVFYCKCPFGFLGTSCENAYIIPSLIVTGVFLIGGIIFYVIYRHKITRDTIIRMLAKRKKLERYRTKRNLQSLNLRLKGELPSSSSEKYRRRASSRRKSGSRRSDYGRLVSLGLTGAKGNGKNSRKSNVSRASLTAGDSRDDTPRRSRNQTTLTLSGASSRKSRKSSSRSRTTRAVD